MLLEDIKGLFKQDMSEFHSIKGQLLGAAGEKAIKTILVSSCYAKEGKTTAAVSIAYALSEEIDYKVLLIDGNFRAPILHKLFGIHRAPGLSDIFDDDYESPLRFKALDDDSLVVIPNGTELSNPLKVLSDDKFKKSLHSLSEEFDYVIVDGTSVSGFSDVFVSAKYFDATILVIECERTRWEVVQEVKERLERVGGNILGIVLNKRIYYIPKAIYGKV